MAFRIGPTMLDSIQTLFQCFAQLPTFLRYWSMTPQCNRTSDAAHGYMIQEIQKEGMCSASPYLLIRRPAIPLDMT
jgi:hypothetical protein